MTQTQNALMSKPGTCDRNWDVPLNANTDFLDSIGAIGRLLVTVTESPSASLNVRVTPGVYAKSDGTLNVFTGTTSYSLPASSTTVLWLTDAGILSSAPSFPTTAHVRLATAVTGPSTVSSVSDERVSLRSCSGAPSSPTKFPEKLGQLSAARARSGPELDDFQDVIVHAGESLDATTLESSPAAAGMVVGSRGVVRERINESGATSSQAIPSDDLVTLTDRINAIIEVLRHVGLM